MAQADWDWTAIERSTAYLTAVIKDETDTAIPVASLTALTLTLYNVANGSIINSRDGQNVLNANGVTVNSSGNLAWTMDPLDNPIVDDTKEYEVHVALFKFEWGSTKRGYHEIRIRVNNLTKV